MSRFSDLFRAFFLQKKTARAIDLRCRSAACSLQHDGLRGAFPDPPRDMRIGAMQRIQRGPSLRRDNQPGTPARRAHPGLRQPHEQRFSRIHHDHRAGNLQHMQQVQPRIERCRHVITAPCYAMRRFRSPLLSRKKGDCLAGNLREHVLICVGQLDLLAVRHLTLMRIMGFHGSFMS